MMWLFLLACASCSSSEPSSSGDGLVVPDDLTAPVEDASLDPPPSPVSLIASAHREAQAPVAAPLPPEEELPADGPAVVRLADVDPTSPLTQADLAILVELARESGREASADWIRSEGPHAPGPLGTTRAEFLDWMKTIAVALGSGFAAGMMFFLKKWLSPLTGYLAEQPRNKEFIARTARAEQMLAEQVATSSELRKLADQLDAQRVANSPQGARSSREAPTEVASIDFTQRGLDALHHRDG